MLDYLPHEVFQLLYEEMFTLIMRLTEHASEAEKGFATKQQVHDVHDQLNKGSGA